MKKREQMEVSFAFLGLLFAFVTSCMIIFVALPLESSETTVYETYGITRQLDLYTMPSHLRSSHRRLLETSDLSDQHHRQVLTPIIPPTASPTSLNVVIEDVDDGYFTEADTVPLVLAGAASTLIICAVFLYGKDAYDRRNSNLNGTAGLGGIHSKPDDKDEITGSGDGSTIVGSTSHRSRLLRLQNQTMSNSSSDSQALVPYEKNQEDTYPSMLMGPEGDDEEMMMMMQVNPSIDQMSTMTESVYTYSNVATTNYASQAWGVDDLAAQANESASCSKATTLSDDCRVDAHTTLKSLMEDVDAGSPTTSPLKIQDLEALSTPQARGTLGGSGAVEKLEDGSPCSSLTSNENDDDDTCHSSLVGEDLAAAYDGDDDEYNGDGNEDGADKFYSPLKGSHTPSFEYTPDEQRDAPSDERSMETELERIIAAVALSDNEDDRSVGNEANAAVDDEKESSTTSESEVVRSIYFAPSVIGPTIEGRVSVGLTLSNDTVDGSTSPYPIVTALDLTSPLMGRVFVGDVIVEIDDADTAGLSGEEALALLELMNGRKMVKMTVCSHESDGVSSSSSSDHSSKKSGGESVTHSVDLGMADTSEEV